MANPKSGRTKAARVGLSIAALVVVLVVGSLVWWVAGASRPDAVVLAALADEDGPADGVTVRALDDGSIAFVADDPIAGLVFYPGGRVDPEAYAPLLTTCAQGGVTCVLVRPPLDFALLDIDAADGAAEAFPEVEDWFVGGHSLGGVAACEYLAKHTEEVDGLVLLASYPNTDLSGYTGKVLRLVGSYDGVVNREKYDAARELLPADTLEETIDGGSHAQFGNYGEQAGDGKATISAEEQQAQVAEALDQLAKAA